MTSYFPPICLGCTHFQSSEGESGHCAAFPDGIPVTIWHSAIDHRQPLEGDHDIQFTPKTADDAEYAEVMFEDEEEPHEHRFVENRCMVCGCGEPKNPHSEGLPTLQPDTPLSAAPHTDTKQQQLHITECPVCHMDADSLTSTGYWYTGMVCPQCNHHVTLSDDHSERAVILDELRALRADVTSALGAGY